MNAHALVLLCIEKFENELPELEKDRFIAQIEAYFGDRIDDYRDEKYAQEN